MEMRRTHANLSEETLGVRDRRRDQVDLLRRRLSLLDGREKVMMTMYLENGISFRQIARLLGVSETSVARRIHRLTKRLTDGEYIVCMRNRDKLTERQMLIAKDYFLTGLSMSRIAEERSWSLYKVCLTVRQIRGIIAEVKKRSELS
jgi:predicted DNA-binding protein YlxM (UPF0122 family)